MKSSLAEHGVHLLDYQRLNKAQKQWADDYFKTAIFPVLTPWRWIRLTRSRS